MAALDTSILNFLRRPLASERVHVHEDVLEQIEEKAESISEVEPELNAYKQSVEKLSLVFKHSAKSPETQNIAKLDVRRGTLWRGGKQLIRIALGSSDSNVRAAAEDLSVLMNNTYGDVPHFSLYGETGSLKHAIADLRNAENTPKVALINGLLGMIDELEDVNKELETLYHKRLQEAEAVKQLGKLSTNLLHTDRLLVALFQALNTVYDYNERTAKLPTVKAAIEHIAITVAAIFDQLKKILDRRHPGAGGGKQKPDITNPEVPGTDTPDPEEPGEGGGDDGGDGGNSGEGGEGTHNPDTENPPIPPFIPDFE